MSILTASMVYGGGEATLMGYAVLRPLANHHLEITIKVEDGNNYGRYHFEKFYFVDGNYTPEAIYEEINNERQSREESIKNWVDFKLVEHRYLPVWDGTLPELTDEQEYAVEAVIPLGYFDYVHTLVKFPFAKDENIQEAFNKEWNEKVTILSVTAEKKGLVDCYGFDVKNEYPFPPAWLVEELQAKLPEGVPF